MADEKTVATLPHGRTATRREAAATPRRGSAPEVVAPTNRINVALPFSHLQVEEASKDLAELTEIVADLVGIVEKMAPASGAKELRARLAVLATRTH